MILSRSKILQELNKGICITPFNMKRLNSNSYNLSLSSVLKEYENDILDMKKDNPVREIHIPEEGYLLYPNRLYLGSTVERTCTDKYIPFIEGRSSVARLGLFVHISAGIGEAGFDGHWTLELTCVKPIIIYPEVPICQVYFDEVAGDIDLCSSKKYQHSVEPIPSKLFEELR